MAYTVRRCRFIPKQHGTLFFPVSYAHDALSRRVTEDSGTARDLYYSGETQTQYVWSPVYVDALVARDRDSERVYVQQDANWNVTALVSTSGDVLERYIYDSYGQVTVLAPDWSTRSNSSHAWVYLHHGGRFEGVSGLYNFRTRDYSPTLGRWMQQVPVPAPDSGNNFYLYAFASPTNWTDPGGSGRATENQQATTWRNLGPAEEVPIAIDWRYSWREVNRRVGLQGLKCILTVTYQELGSYSILIRRTQKQWTWDPAAIQQINNQVQSLNNQAAAAQQQANQATANYHAMWLVALAAGANAIKWGCLAPLAGPFGAPVCAFMVNAYAVAGIVAGGVALYYSYQASQ